MFNCSDALQPTGCDCCSAGRWPTAMQAMASMPPPTNIEAMTGAGRARTASGGGDLVIDCHGHYTTEPKEVLEWRKRQIAAIGDASQMPSVDELEVSDDQLRQSV